MLISIGNTLTWVHENGFGIALETGMLCKAWAKLTETKLSPLTGRACDYCVTVYDAIGFRHTIQLLGKTCCSISTKGCMHQAKKLPEIVFNVTKYVDVVASKIFDGKWSYLPLVKKINEIAIIGIEAAGAKKLWCKAEKHGGLSLVGKCRFALASGYVALGSLAVWKPTNTLFSGGSLACFTIEVLLGWFRDPGDSFVTKPQKKPVAP